jgi:hypothetical protein
MNVRLVVVGACRNRARRLLGAARDRAGVRARWAVIALAAMLASGCRSPYYADKGALLGGGVGAVTGAVIGNQLGSTAGGAIIGAGVGALTGAAVGNAIDDVDARNQARIQAQLGRALPPGGVSVEDVIAMTQAGVTEDVISTHIQYHGMVRPLTTADIIRLQQSGVSPRVIQVAQQPPRVPVAQPVSYGPPPAVVVEEIYYAPPPPPPCYYRPRPHVHIHGRF